MNSCHCWRDKLSSTVWLRHSLQVMQYSDIIIFKDVIHSTRCLCDMLILARYWENRDIVQICFLYKSLFIWTNIVSSFSVRFINKHWNLILLAFTKFSMGCICASSLWWNLACLIAVYTRACASNCSMCIVRWRYAHFKKLDYFSTECIYSPNAYRCVVVPVLFVTWYWHFVLTWQCVCCHVWLYDTAIFNYRYLSLLLQLQHISLSLRSSSAPCFECVWGYLIRAVQLNLLLLLYVIPFAWPGIGKQAFRLPVPPVSNFLGMSSM